MSIYYREFYRKSPLKGGSGGNSRPKNGDFNTNVPILEGICYHTADLRINCPPFGVRYQIFLTPGAVFL
jgi:hypothetical protein